MKYVLREGWTMQRFVAVLEENFKDGRTRCAGYDMACMYRGVNLWRSDSAPKCAVGAFIPDAIYEPWMEDHQPEFLEERGVDMDWAPLDAMGLLDLQGVHDGAHRSEPVLPVILAWVRDNVVEAV